MAILMYWYGRKKGLKSYMLWIYIYISANICWLICKYGFNNSALAMVCALITILILLAFFIFPYFASDAQFVEMEKTKEIFKKEDEQKNVYSGELQNQVIIKYYTEEIGYLELQNDKKLLDESGIWSKILLGR